MSAACLMCCYECGCDRCADKTENAMFGKSKHGWLNCLCSPIALVAHSIYAYFFVCIGVYLDRALNHFFCYPCIHNGACNSCYLFTDKRFPADDVSLGKTAAEENIVWKRAGEVLEKPILFQEGVHPNDVVQGDLGNCWLLSAFASLAEFPGLADKVFVTREKSTRGKYRVKLFNGWANRWEIICVDDLFPMKEIEGAAAPAQPQAEEGEGEGEAPVQDIEAAKPKTNYEFVYAKPKNGELWVAVLEKAFAKFRGSYQNLAGGNTLWAFHALTGDNCFRLRKCEEEGREGVWEKLVLAHDKKPDDISPIGVKANGESIRENDLFGLLRAYDRSKALLGASMKSEVNEDGTPNEEVVEDLGLIRGHAYSIIAAKRVGKKKAFDLIQLRNPWGKLEWKGDWSDTSEKWEEYPGVAEALEFKKDESDGTFWMEFTDFMKLFDNIDICDRTVNYADFTLVVHENPDDCLKHTCGPTQGMLEGCADFWCRCKGIKYIYCGNESSAVMKKSIKGRDDRFFAEMKAL